MTFLGVSWATLLQRGAEHCGLVLSALTVSVCFAVPLGMLIARCRHTAFYLGVLNMAYTVPSLALFALLVPFMGLGMLTAITALSVYGTVILTRSVVIGVLQVPIEARESAVALGYSTYQALFAVELPLACATVVSGIRIASVMLIATASIAAWIDGGGLGVLLFQGIREDNMSRILAGTLCAAILALVADTILARWEQTCRRYSGL